MELPIVNKEYKSYRDYTFDRNNQNTCWRNFVKRLNKKVPFKDENAEYHFQCFMRRRLPTFFRYPELRAKIKGSEEYKLLREIFPWENEFFDALDNLPFMPHPPSKRR